MSGTVAERKPSEPPTPCEPGAQVSICMSLLDDIQEQIRHADSKAGFISMLNVFLFGFIASNFEKVQTLCCSGKGPGTAAVVLVLTTVALYLAFTAASLTLVVTCVVSRFAQRSPDSKVFFGHIARRYGADPAQFAKVVCQMSEGQWVEELSRQIAEISALAVTKHQRIRWATMTTLASVLLWVIALVAIVTIRWLHP